MTVTILGFVCIALALFFIVSRRTVFLLYAAVFFSGFSGSSVANIGDIPVQPSLFFFALYFIACLFRRNVSIALPKLLLLFFAYCAASVLSAVLLSGSNISIMDQQGDYSPLSFSTSNLIHVGYLLISLLFLNCLLKFSPRNRGKLMKAYRLGFYAVVLICLYQILAFQYSLPFDELFRQSPNGNVQGNRLYGPCAEASMLCYYLVPSAFLMVFTASKRKWLDIVFALLSVLVGFMTSSSTFLVGVFVSLVCALLYFLVKKDVSKFVGCCAGIFLGILCLEIVQPGTISKTVVALSDKLAQNNMSGQERMSSFINMFSVGLRYPFGVGFGSARSKDLLSTWVCNIGIFGFAIYFAFLLSIVPGGANKIVLKLPFLITNLLMFISVSEPYNYFIWFLCFVALAEKERSKIFVFDQWHKAPRCYSNCALPIVMLSAKSNVSASAAENAESSF